MKQLVQSMAKLALMRDDTLFAQSLGLKWVNQSLLYVNISACSGSFLDNRIQE